MHQTRQEASKLLPIPRKGTKYVARALSHQSSSVPVVIALREMLGLAKTAKEVNEMIKQKLLRINGREVKDCRESIRLFSIFSAGNKSFKLTILPAGRFHLEEVRGDKTRICKIIGKKILKGNKTQIALHDGSNLITKEKLNINDSLSLDFNGRIISHSGIEKGKKALIFSGKHLGYSGLIENVHDNKSLIKINDKSAEIDNSRFIVI